MAAAPYEPTAATRSLATSLLREGYSVAARIIVHQDRFRKLPTHPLDTLLIVSEDRVGVSPGPSKPTLGSAIDEARRGSTKTGLPGGEAFCASVQGPVVKNAIHTAIRSKHPAQVKTVSSLKYKESLTTLLASRCREKKFSHSFTGAERSYCALRAQSPAALTTFTIDGVMSSNILPGGAPILDHAIAALSADPDWGRTLSTLKEFAKQRVTSPVEENLPEMRELVVGESGEAEYREVAKWLTRKHSATKAKYGFCLPALDVECVNIRLATGSRLSDFELELRTNDDNKVDVPVAKQGDRGNNLQFPVLLMYGGIGWQLHIRIPVSYKHVGKELHVVISESNADPTLLVRLFRKFRPAIGAGIQKDLDEFRETINIINTTSITAEQMPTGIPLGKVLMLAGIDHPQSSLLSTVYMTLGGVLAKDWRCSNGDNRWGEPLSALDPSLKAYLAGDIQQTSVAASTLTIVWAAHIFPDPKLIRSELEIDPLDFIATWVESVVQEELPRQNGALYNNANGSLKSRDELIRLAGLDVGNPSSLLTLCPTWPSITAGGPKSLGETRRFSKQALILFRSRYEGILPEPMDTDQPAATEAGKAAPAIPMEIAGGPPADTSTPMEGVQTSEVKVVAPNGDQPSLPTPRPVNQICPYCGYAFQTVPALASHIAGCVTKTLQPGNAPVAAFPATAPAPTAGRRRGETRVVATGEAREMVGKTQRDPTLKTSTDAFFDQDPKDLDGGQLNELSRSLENSARSDAENVDGRVL